MFSSTAWKGDPKNNKLNFLLVVFCFSYFCCESDLVPFGLNAINTNWEKKQPLTFSYTVEKLREIEMFKAWIWESQGTWSELCRFENRELMTMRNFNDSYAVWVGDTSALCLTTGKQLVLQLCTAHPFREGGSRLASFCHQKFSNMSWNTSLLYGLTLREL